MHRLLPAILAILLAGMLAPAAQAAKVSIATSDSGIVYVNVSGGAEADVLTVSSPAPDRYTVTQAAGLPLTVAGQACSVVAPGRVDCTAARVAGALLVGGDGNDRLAISGAVGQGAWLFGMDGADDLTGGPGADRLDGGAGADVLHARDGRTDELFCGTEADAADADDVDTISPDCEQRIAGPITAPAPDSPSPGLLPGPLPAPLPTPVVPPAPVDVATGPVALSHGAVPMRVTCSADSSCHGWIVLRLLPRRAGHKAAAAGSRRPVIARRRYRVGAGHSKSLRVHISRRGRQRVLQRRKARCSVRVSTVAPDGTKQVRERKVTITAGGGR